MKVTSGALALGLIAGVYVVAVLLGQRSVLFPAPWAPTRISRGPAEIVWLPQPAGAVEALLLLPSDSSATPAPLVIFMHGNAELADQWVDQFAVPRSWGWAVLLVEYPGYGRSAGHPSEASITAAASAALEWARRDVRLDAARIVAYGRSLGGGPAARLAADHQLAGLILESTFTSVRPLAARYLIPGILVRDPFDNLAALTRYRGPLLVLHGRRDELIPVAHGRALAAAVAGADFHELSCGHNDCRPPWEIIGSFFTNRGLTPSIRTGQSHNPALQGTGARPPS